MLKLIRFISLVSESVFIQFEHLVGPGALLIAAALGYFRVPSWAVPIFAVVCGVIADKYVDETDVTGLLERASNANQRGGFLIVVFFVISTVGYIAGAYGRHYYVRAKRAAPAASQKK
jgi:hypothetical protein